MKVHIGSPVWRQLEARHVTSLIGVLREPGFSYFPQVGDALVERARSIAATYFLRNTDSDVFLSIDSDITDFRVADVKKVCEQAMTSDIVVALYTTRATNRTFPTTFVEEGEIEMSTNTDDLVPCIWGATGFMAVHRRVFEKLAEGLPLLHEADGERAFYPFYVPFWVPYEDQTILLSEDYAFCERAKEAGFQTWLNPGVRIGHIGQYIYRIEDMITQFPEPQPVVLSRKGKTWAVSTLNPIPESRQVRRARERQEATAGL